MQNLVVMFTFSILEQEYTFGASLVPKFKIVSLFRNLVTWLIRIQWWCSIFLFLIGINLFWQIWSKTQNCSLKLKLGIKTNSNMQNSVVRFVLSVLDLKYNFWANLVQKVETVCLEVVSFIFLLVCFLSLKESTCETRKNVFYFTLKAAFLVIEKIKF